MSDARCLDVDACLSAPIDNDLVKICTFHFPTILPLLEDNGGWDTHLVLPPFSLSQVGRVECAIIVITPGWVTGFYRAVPCPLFLLGRLPAAKNLGFDGQSTHVFGSFRYKAFILNFPVASNGCSETFAELAKIY